jgi:AraC-like DNA-binding protein
MEPKFKIGSQAAIRIVEFAPKNQHAGQNCQNGRADEHAAEQWQALDRVPSHFSASRAHEFRTPLALLLGHIEKMRSRMEDEESQRDLQLMQRYAQDLLRLVEKNSHEAGETLSGVFQISEINVTSVDDAFLKKAVAVVEKHLDDESFSVEDLAREMGLCRVQFHRKIRALTNHSTTHFIRAIRLQHAAALLKQNYGTVTEIAYQVGFSSHPYFTKCFQEYFGMSPKEYKMQR